MQEKFKRLISELDTKYEALMSMAPLTVETVPKDAPIGGIYLFSSGGKHLYNIRAMEVRYVAESDPTRQALLEIYVATVTEAKYNDFDTH